MLIRILYDVQAGLLQHKCNTARTIYIIYVVMADSHGLYSYGLYKLSYGLYSYGLYSYDLL